MDSPLDFELTVVYVDLVRLIKPYLLSLQPPAITSRPDALPWNVVGFLCDALALSEDQINSAWTALGDLVWARDILGAELLAAQTKYIEVFLQYGLIQNRGIDRACGPTLRSDPKEVLERDLVEPSRLQVTVFTRELGAVPAFATSWYCRKCHTRYFHNYCVQGNERTYYIGVDQRFLQIGTHFYIERSLCELFSVMMATAWTSSTNCARIYHEGLTNTAVSRLLPPDWRFGFELDVKLVSNAFYLHALLLHHKRHGTVLKLRHQAPSPAERLRPALEARNLQMVGTGQDAWNHACTVCCWFQEQEDGSMSVVRSTVTDGVTVGRPCCGQHDCKGRLPNVKRRYCEQHQDKVRNCAVLTCTGRVSDGYRTCDDPDHRWIETYYEMQGKAMFQLKHRLRRAQASQPNDALSAGTSSSAAPLRHRGGDEFDENEDEDELEGDGMHADEAVEISSDITCNGKPDTGNRTFKASFGRNRTQCEELCVSCCGVILGRATMVGSEAPNGVLEFWETIFPTKESLPQVLWYDNNCRIAAMLRNEPKERQEYFADIAKPVDVFHFKCKHKEKDIDCGRECNALLWPELSDNGKWRFNSSAAEQTNAWFGGFASIVREMSVERYEFFLDEMIRRRNIWMISLLEKRGSYPHSIPREDLLSGRSAVTQMDVDSF
uniref:CxC5 like cysteine cluster associated with KDZ domain-containing protein n=1 Tax=Mycena chlorophos TaxID=658473 RepID=A0ABQ0M7S3_MYCCL|nr:predicted protein [Mycena chlorophos]